MVNVLQNFHHSSCASLHAIYCYTLQLHALSKTVHPLSCDDPDVALVHEIQITVSSVKSFTAYFKQTGLNNKLK